MNGWMLIRRSLSFHARAHIGVVLGAAVGSAALVGALVVGDSVRGSLHDLAAMRLGKTDVAMASGDRFFRAQLAVGIQMGPPLKSAPVLELPGTATAQESAARANHVQILGVDERFWKLAEQPPETGAMPADGVVLNEPLAAQLKVKAGDTVLLRVQKPSLLSRDAPVSPQEDTSVALRLTVKAVVTEAQFGRFSLQANQIAPLNAFVSLTQLEQMTGQTNRANLLLCPAAGGPVGAEISPTTLLRAKWQLTDAELQLRTLPPGDFELRTDRVFLDPPVVEAGQRVATNVQPVITYLVNEIRDGTASTPYSMVTAIGAPIVAPEMRDDEILINDWLAQDLGAKTGDTISLAYYIIANGRALEERRNDFKVHGIIPMTGAAADRTLMPDFPGLAQAESTRNWDAGFPIQIGKIRDKDEQYWKEFRGTPKAFVTLAAGTKMWANRFGDYTAVRIPKENGSITNLEETLLRALNPSSFGLNFQRVRAQAEAASSQSMDFGGLFIGFSFFLIVAALLLMALLFQFGLEQRATEVGTLLALGFRAKQVRRLLLIEGAALALAGGVIGAAGGIVYAKAMLTGLTTVWKNAVGAASLHFHVTAMTLVIGAFSSFVVALLTIWLALRRQARRPARELLAEGAETLRMAGGTLKKSKGRWVGGVSAALAVGMIGMAMAQRDTSSAETFFCAGALLLIAGLGFSAAWLGALARRAEGGRLTMGDLGLRGSTRRRKRSLATIGLLACGVFLIVAVGAFRLDAKADATKRSSGTGGFALLGESTLPVTYDLNARAGRDFYGLNFPEMTNVSVVAFRVRDGDEASCLNLNRAQTPRLLGVNPEALQKRGAFTFAEVMKGLPAAQGWGLLKKGDAGEIPAIGDENAILWAMGKKVGDTVDYTDEHGQRFKLRLVGAVANSILQGNLVIDEAEFVKRFPGESGYRMFLLDAPSNDVAKVSAAMTRALQDAGFELTPAPQRLNEFNAVENTYLSTFQVLGGLGLLLGSAGLGIVVLRNVQERRGELGLLLAVGFRRRELHRLVLGEHSALLGLGLGVGVVAAVIGVLPALLSPGSQIPYGSLGVTLLGVLLNGLLWTWLATRFALRGRLLDALRNE